MEDGILRKAGKIPVLELSGSYRRMGCQYGRLLKDRLGEFYEAAVNRYFIKEGGMSYIKLLVLAWILFHRYPAKFKDMLGGMSEASGVSLSKLIMLDQLNAFELVRNQKIGRCSNIAAWGDYSDRGGLVFGRNFDQPEYFKKFNEFITLAIFSPDGGIPFANIGYAGQIGISSAMNKKGVIVANNEAPVMKGDAVNLKAVNVLVAEFEFMTQSDSLDVLDKLMRSAKANCPIIVSAADARAACTYEWTASDIKRVSGKGGGLTAATNHFTDPSWNRKTPAADEYGMTGIRLDNLMFCGEEYKGRFNARKMQELLDTTVDEGGATHRDKTILQMVAVPEDLKFYIKIPAFQDWTEIDLKVPFDRCGAADDFELSAPMPS